MSRKTRKLIWSAPLVAVFAVAGALAIFAALGPGSVFANPLPDEPTELTVKKADEDAGRTTLLLSWTAPSGAVDGYRIDVSEGHLVWENLVSADNPHTSTSYTHAGLTSADTRFYRVFAVNSHGISGVSNVVSATTDAKAKPDGVQNLQAVANGQKQIDLSWGAPADNGGEKITGYLVLYHTGGNWEILPGVGTLPGTTTPSGFLSEGTSHEDKHKLSPGEKRNYRVIAYNAAFAAFVPSVYTAGEGIWAETHDDHVNVSDHQQDDATTAPATAPGRVTGLTAVNTGPTEITLYWYGPQSNGGFPLSHYLVQAHRSGESFPDVPDNDELADVVTVQPILGTGDATNPEWRIQVIPAVTTDTDPTSQAVITTETVNHDGDSTTDDVEVTWSFRVYAISADGTTFRRSDSPSNTASKKAAARATVEVGGDRVDPLAAPTLEAAERGGTSELLKAGRIEVEISILIGGAAQNAYRLDYSDDGGLTWQLLVPDTRFTGFTLDRRYSDTLNLGYDDSRRYRAFALGANSAVGPASVGEQGHTIASSAPDAPTGVTAMASANRKEIHVSWTAPEDDGGQPISNYYVQYATDDGDGVAEATDFDNDQSDVLVTMSTATSYTVKPETALRAEMDYYVRVASVNKDPLAANVDRPVSTAVTNWSKLADFNTSEAAAPGMVEGLTSELATDASGDARGVLLLWNKPESGGAPMTYHIQRKVNDGDFADWRNDARAWAASSTAYTDPDDEFEAGEMRTYRVRSVNADGMSGWAMVDYPREPAAGDHPHGRTAPDIASATVSGSSVTIVWTDGAPADSHSVGLVSTTDYSVVAEEDMPTGNMATFDNVPDGTYFAIVASFEGFEYEFDLQTVTVPGN